MDRVGIMFRTKRRIISLAEFEERAILYGYELHSNKHYIRIPIKSQPFFSDCS